MSIDNELNLLKIKIHMTEKAPNLSVLRETTWRFCGNMNLPLFNLKPEFH